ncbi:uncharacterized protein N7506_009251 [Penicillium brevicompactum]|uniref:uncharacterized protein n=1 Tax=Penicillium brevicompactum TaxID=5074 RepID=UPI0025424850|nr:uncharacterized protein N7506_009251 [Penicillium brevicompactum]KAJ5326149.1 hypothetical protein N7506_009251 [Penicillium brevicompactum]
MHISINLDPMPNHPDPGLAPGLDPSLETERHAQAPASPIPTPPPPPPTAQKYYYFAYGSNLSPTQMAARCNQNPSSSEPLAIATLPHWRWLICEAGYANVLPPPGLRVPNQDSEPAHEIPVSGSEDTVYGLLYEMDLRDEKLLDGYEGIDTHAKDADGEFVDVDVRPKEQGKGSYNKWFVEANVVNWLDGREDQARVKALVYVDEQCVSLSEPKFEYIARMNRGIRESVELGVSQRWVDEVIRKFIPEDA